MHGVKRYMKRITLLCLLLALLLVSCGDDPQTGVIGEENQGGSPNELVEEQSEEGAEDTEKDSDTPVGSLSNGSTIELPDDVFDE